MRTYIRTLFNDLFKDNFLVRCIVRFVNFCCKSFNKNQNAIKFSSELPIEELKEKKTFSFQSVSGDEIDCK